MAYQTVFKRYELKYLITAEQKKRLLDSFSSQWEEDRYGRTFKGGYGIGLSMAKAIVQKHRREITAYQKGESQIGFKVVLPL